MPPPIPATRRLLKLFSQHPVQDLPALFDALGTTSRMTVFRRLKKNGYFSSFTHAGRYYTLADIPDFDEAGLWWHQGVGFSRAGTLKSTVALLVEESEAGHTHGELETRLRVRVHNALLGLVRERRLARQRIDSVYLYVSPTVDRAAHQVLGRQALARSAGGESVALPTEVVIAVLVEALAASEGLASAAVVAASLAARGQAVTAAQVERVYAEYGLVPEKKNGGATLSTLAGLRGRAQSLQALCQRQVHDIAGAQVVVHEEPGACPQCGGPMYVQKTVPRMGRTSTHGAFTARETIHVCAARCRHPNGSLVTQRAAAMREALLPQRTVGYDVMVIVGVERYLCHRQREEIQDILLRKHGLSLSTGSISDLARLFGQYLHALHQARAPKLRAALELDGGWPLHIDATGENGRGTLLVAFAGWRGWVLGAWKIPTERADAILPRLQDVVVDFGPPCAVVRDLGRAMIPAANDLVAELDRPIPILSCHAHFLADVGKDLLDASHSALRKLFRHHKVRPGLRGLARDIGRRLGGEISRVRHDVAAWMTPQDGHHALPRGKSAGLGVVRALAQWALDYPADSTGADFPFDRPYLDLHDRCIHVRRAIDAFLRQPPADKEVHRALLRLARILDPVRRVSAFTQAATTLRGRAKLFDELRTALRLHSAESGGPDLGGVATVRQLRDIRAHVDALFLSLKERRPQRGPAQDTRKAIDLILVHLERYGESLWGHAITLPAQAGGGLRLVQRTNNILEGFYRTMKQEERRRSGRKTLSDDFEHLPAVAALARNLLCPDYVEVVCGTMDRLGHAFFELDAARRSSTLAALPSLDQTPSVDLPEPATASLPKPDRHIVRFPDTSNRILAAARSRAPRVNVEHARC